MSLGPDIHIQTAAEFPTTKIAYHLWGYVRTDVPGYRELQIGSYLCRVASGTYRWDDFIVALNTALGGAGWTASLDSRGQTYLGPSDIAALTCPDRLGWLLGFGVEAGTSFAAAEEFIGRFVPPGGFPLVGADWSDVTLDREVRASLDRQRRGSGMAWGSARLWRTVLTMTRWQLEAFKAGWVRSGRIAIVPVGYESTAMSGSEPKGHLDGYVVSDERVRWIDPVERFAEVTFIVATPAT